MQYLKRAIVSHINLGEAELGARGPGKAESALLVS